MPTSTGYTLRLDTSSAVITTTNSFTTIDLHASGLAALYGIDGMQVDLAEAAQPGAHPPVGLPNFTREGEILPPDPDGPR